MFYGKAKISKIHYGTVSLMWNKITANCPFNLPNRYFSMLQLNKKKHRKAGDKLQERLNKKKEKAKEKEMKKRMKKKIQEKKEAKEE